MTLAEFKAWLDGFKEAVGDAPTPEQWQRIVGKLATVYEPLPVLPALPAQPYPSFPLSPVWCGPATSTGTGSLRWQSFNSAELGDPETLYEN